MLVQLKQAGVFERVAGIVFGAILPLNGSEPERELISGFIADQTAGLKCRFCMESRQDMAVKI